jgi:hypothetical protein
MTQRVRKIDTKRFELREQVSGPESDRERLLVACRLVAKANRPEERVLVVRHEAYR